MAALTPGARWPHTAHAVLDAAGRSGCARCSTAARATSTPRRVGDPGVGGREGPRRSDQRALAGALLPSPEPDRTGVTICQRQARLPSLRTEPRRTDRRGTRARFTISAHPLTTHGLYACPLTVLRPSWHLICCKEILEEHLNADAWRPAKFLTRTGGIRPYHQWICRPEK